MSEKGPRRPVLILGLGNPFWGDDGIGPAVVEALSKVDLPPEVELLDGGTAGLGLLGAIERRERLLVVDAAELGRPAGSFVHVRPDEAGLHSCGAPLSPHQMGLVELLELAGRLEIAPREVQIFAVQPGRLESGKDLSPAVRASLPRITAAILAEISRLPGQLAQPS